MAASDRWPVVGWLKVLVVVWFVLTGLGCLVNGGEVRLDGPIERYHLLDHRIYQPTKMVSPEGVKRVKEWIETRTRPSYGILTLIWQHLWYNAVTSGYELHFWLEDRQRTLTSYGIYQSGRTLFLRVEPSCWHRVLTADFTAREFENLLASHMVPIPAEWPVPPPPPVLPAEAPPGVGPGSALPSNALPAEAPPVKTIPAELPPGPGGH